MNPKNILKSLGPGLLWAGAAIGVSHLVQSTRAGANYGFALIWVIVIVNILKYPFFEYGPRYATATGESLIYGYRRIGKWVLWLYVALTVGTMFTLQAAITVVTSGLIANIFQGSLSIFQWAIILLIICSAIVLFGKYSILDKLIKFIIILLTISTIVAVISAFTNGFNPNPEFIKTFDWKLTDVAFLIALAGWMPSAIDISVWHSAWSVAKVKESGYKPTMKESLFDFNVGYIGTAILSIGFMSLGALVMFGTGNSFSGKSAVFAGQLIDLYTNSIGNWAYYLIAIAALTTMFSTTLTCLDAYPRILKPTTKLLLPKTFPEEKRNKSLTYFWLGILVIGTLIILKFSSENGFKFLVDLATTLSFLTAPILGYMNWKVITGKNVNKVDQPKNWLRILNWIGLISLSLFGISYIVWKFFIN
jgi:Mn2+/Fe2+ NRAMP family transporter